MYAQEPYLVLQSLAIWGVPYVAYFVGILIRKTALPGPNSPPLLHQFLLGIPVGLVLVSPSLALLRTAIVTDIGAYLLTVGIIIEHGMLVQETATKHLRSLRKGRASRSASRTLPDTTSARGSVPCPD